MVMAFKLLSKGSLQWLYSPFQRCDASVNTIKSFQLMMLKHIQSLEGSDDLQKGGFAQALLDQPGDPISDEVVMDAVLMTLQFGEIVLLTRSMLTCSR